jgi:hypothetical protein
MPARTARRSSRTSTPQARLSRVSYGFSAGVQAVNTSPHEPQHQRAGGLVELACPPWSDPRERRGGRAGAQPSTSRAVWPSTRAPAGSFIEIPLPEGGSTRMRRANMQVRGPNPRMGSPQTHPPALVPQGTPGAPQTTANRSLPATRPRPSRHNCLLGRVVAAGDLVGSDREADAAKPQVQDGPTAEDHAARERGEPSPRSPHAQRHGQPKRARA